MIKRPSDKVDSLQTNVNSLSKRQMTDNVRKVDKLQGVCYYCRKPRHLRRDCMVRQRAKCFANSEQPKQSDGTDGDKKGQNLTKGKTNACYRVVAMSNCADRKLMVEGQIGSSEEKFATDIISSMVGRTFKDPSRGHDFDEGKEHKNPCRGCDNGRTRTRRMRRVPGKMLMRPQGVYANDNCMQVMAILPGKAALKSPDFKENQLQKFHKRRKASRRRNNRQTPDCK